MSSEREEWLIGLAVDACGRAQVGEAWDDGTMHGFRERWCEQFPANVGTDLERRDFTATLAALREAYESGAAAGQDAELRAAAARMLDYVRPALNTDWLPHRVECPVCGMSSVVLDGGDHIKHFDACPVPQLRTALDAQPPASPEFARGVKAAASAGDDLKCKFPAASPAWEKAVCVIEALAAAPDAGAETQEGSDGSE